MRTITIYLAVLLTLLCVSKITGQEDYKERVKVLKGQKAEITVQEKEALKLEISEINKLLEQGEITLEEATNLKKNSAKKRALNIENRIAILENRISLLERNKGKVQELDTLNYKTRLEIGFGDNEFEDTNLFGVRLNKNPSSKILKHDIRTYSDFVLGVGFHNNVIQGQPFFDTPHSILGSRYFELGYLWKTRVLKNSNWLRLNYGVIYENKGLKSDNQLFVEVSNSNEGRDIILENVENIYNESDISLRKSKFRQDAFIFPIHLEFGPSNKRQNGDYFRYSTRRKLKFGFGAYLGLPLRSVQKTKFKKFDSGFIRSVNIRPLDTSAEVGAFWGWSLYAGRGNTTVVFKLEGSDNLLSGSQGSRQNVSLGLRLDL